MAANRTTTLLFLILWLSLAAVSPAHASGGCAADLTGNGTVGVDDLTQLIGMWGTDDPRADLNGNDYVGDADLSTLFDNWGACPTCPADLDGDGQVGPVDRDLLEKAYGTDCSANLGRFADVGDYDLDILNISWTGVGDPDADPRADLNGNGVVNVDDLVQLLSQWGTDCTTDLNSDGDVDTDDLWALLGAWGPCP